MPHTPREKKKVLTRVRRIKGQLSAIETSLEDDVECADVLQQVAAVRGAVNGLMRQILESHVRETLGPGDTSDEERADHVEELAELLRSYLK